MQLELLTKPALNATLRDMIWRLICGRPGIHKEELAEELQIPERHVRQIIHEMRVDPEEERLIAARDGYYPIRTWEKFLEWDGQESARWRNTLGPWWAQRKKAIKIFGKRGLDMFVDEDEGVRIMIQEKTEAEAETKRG